MLLISKAIAYHHVQGGGHPQLQPNAITALTLLRRWRQGPQKAPERSPDRSPERAPEKAPEIFWWRHGDAATERRARDLEAKIMAAMAAFGAKGYAKSEL